MKKIRSALLMSVILAVCVLGFAFFEERRYAFSALALAAASLYFSIRHFENRTHAAAVPVIIAVMSALASVGRIAFAWLPGVSPVSAIIALTAFSFGPSVGFASGALSAFISNFYFSHGPWTPFQMLSLGLIGLFAGICAKPLKKSRPLLLVFAVLSGAFYSVIMDIWTVLWYNQDFGFKAYLAALCSSLPFTAIYAVSNCVFLILLKNPVGRKLDRLKIRYGL